jgi:protein disulfide-isomerase
MRLQSILSLALPLLSSVVTAQQDRTSIEQHADSLTIPRLQRRDEPAAAQGAMEGHDGKTKTDGGAGEGTIFNGKRVPPSQEIAGDDLDDTIKSGYWMVEFFSPYCGHCKHFAPTWQTMYEFYYTDDPVPQSQGTEDDLNGFTKYYDFHFAKVDCVANGDACAAHNIGSFPTVVLFKDGVKISSNTGAQNLAFMSTWVEETLETIKPGSRVKGGPKLPAVGDHTVDKPLPEPVPLEKEKTSTTVAATSTKSTIKATKVVKPIPNAAGKSQDLTAESFQRLVTMTHDPWFIKFYAPWCPHCQHLAPNWQGMARKMEGEVNIGEVNCDIEKRLCRDVKVKGYPTILFFRGGERIEYDGLRGLGDLILFAQRTMAVEEGVRDVTAAEFEELEEKEEVIFLYCYDQATTSEDFAALERLVMSLIGHAKLVKSSDPELSQRFKISTWPRLLVSRDGKPSYYEALSPQTMRDTRRVLDWMQSVWLPIVPELTASNAREIMDNKLVVLGILSRDRPEEFAIAKREIKNAALEWIDKQTQQFQLARQELRDAKQLRIEEAEDRNNERALRSAKGIQIKKEDIELKEVGFAWVDGVFWERWIRTTYGISVRDGERVVINDEANKRYWDSTVTGNSIVSSRTSILETLSRIVANPTNLPPKSTTTPLGHIWWVIRGGFLSHPLVSAIILMVFFAGGAIYARSYVKKTGGYIKLSEKGGPMDGLLGGNSGAQGQGKVD